ncbi:uncharacterized protein C8N43_0733 [Litoreibacter ponti]|uniref:TPM domain-containing protein n=1 Tax=Litoreibacter ponti TaxID=1510457 RepID=A0A2T6BJ56_9RHOB|nr:TPM domain-containing protein [Litoreibacter ponti]PTX56082.1 uncharacterized protein C8N43_0733 [Litoreibacter ponti]
MMRVLCVLVMMALPGLAQAQAEKLPYPQYYSVLTNDFADILSEEAEAQINAELIAARETRGLEMAVVTIRSREDYLPSADIASFAKDLFNGWGIGNKERNDGILLLVAIEDRQVRLALGAGYDARQDGIAARIIQTDILPAFRQGRVADGVLAGTRAALSRLAIDGTPPPPPQAVTPAPTGEVRPPEPLRPAVIEQPPEPRDPGAVAQIGRWVSDMLKQAEGNPIAALLIVALTAVGGFFGIRGVQHYRPRKCPECGRVMLRLGEAQEDQYLDHGQLVEERLKSKNYGVWFCTNDEHVTVIGYPSLFSRRKACPSCNYHTLETSRTVTMPASTVAFGQAKLDHLCQNCDHTYSEFVVIPKLAESSGSSGDRSGFSSSSSGGFGGGSSSGGGASGSW